MVAWAIPFNTLRTSQCDVDLRHAMLCSNFELSRIGPQGDDDLIAGSACTSTLFLRRDFYGNFTRRTVIFTELSYGTAPLYILLMRIYEIITPFLAA
jgi:hypothetical protein